MTSLASAAAPVAAIARSLAALTCARHSSMLDTRYSAGPFTALTVRSSRATSPSAPSALARSRAASFLSASHCALQR
jgi:hypothetical protein